MGQIDGSALDSESGPARQGMMDIDEVGLCMGMRLAFDHRLPSQRKATLIPLQPGSTAVIAAGMRLPACRVLKPETGDNVT